MEKPGTLEGIENVSSEDFINMLTEETEKVTPSAGDPPPVVEKVEEKALVIPVTKTLEEIEAEKTASIEAEKQQQVETEKAAKEKEITEAKEKLTTDIAAATTDEDKKKLQADFDAKYPTEEPKKFEFKTLDEKAAEEEESDGWLELSKKDGFDITEDTYEAYVAGRDKFYKEKYQIDLGKYQPETQRFIEFLESGGTINSFIEPLRPLNELRNLDDVALITKDLEMQEWDPAKIEKEIARMSEKDGEVELSAYKIRKQIDTIEERLKEKIVNDTIVASDRQTTYKQTSTAEELTSIKKELNTMSAFLEIPLGDKHKAGIVKKLESGQYNDVINNPKAKMQAILWHEFGKEGVNLLKEKVLAEAKLEIKKDRHNIPPPASQGGAQSRSTSTTEVKAEGNWAVLGSQEEFDQAYFGTKK